MALTLQDLIAGASAAAQAEADAGAAVVADKAKLTADEQALVDAHDARQAADSTLDGALGAVGPVQTTDGTVYELITGARRVFKPTPAAEATVPGVEGPFPGQNTDPIPGTPAAADPAA